MAKGSKSNTPKVRPEVQAEADRISRAEAAGNIVSRIYALEERVEEIWVAINNLSTAIHMIEGQINGSGYYN